MGGGNQMSKSVSRPAIENLQQVFNRNIEDFSELDIEEMYEVLGRLINIAQKPISDDEGVRTWLGVVIGLGAASVILHQKIVDASNNILLEARSSDYTN